MNEDRKQLVERLQQASNVLITVNNSPSVDQLAACIGFTILLNKLNKHATAVFSGDIPSTLEFLKPEDTIEKNTDSLRDFIIALDKSKADKLRYKVEDTMVKIFITPYKTSISDADLEFSQGDFNVDVVLALGIHEREQVDNAIVSHGRILHDAVVMSVNTKVGDTIGTINWVDEQASSLCEMLASVAEELQPQSLDAQIATALLTGVVAETERFSNQKTTSATMEISSKLMASGADQQLVASKLEPKFDVQQSSVPDEGVDEVKVSDDGAIVIDHTDEPLETSEQEQELPPVYSEEPEQVQITNEPKEPRLPDQPGGDRAGNESSRLVTTPPTMGGTLTANSKPEPLDPSTDPLSAAFSDSPVLTHSSESTTPTLPGSGAPTSIADVMSQSTGVASPVNDNQTIEEIEEAVSSKQPDAPSLDRVSKDTEPSPPSPVVDQQQAEEDSDAGPAQNPVATLDNARDAVSSAIGANSDFDPPQAIAGLNAQPVNLDLGHDLNQSTENPYVADSSTAQPQVSVNDIPTNSNMPNNTAPSDVNDPNAPPPVPPPMMPPFNTSSTASPQQ